MDRQTGEFGGEPQETEQGPVISGREVTHARMAHTAFGGAREVVTVAGDVFSAEKFPRQLSGAEIAALPDSLTLEAPGYDEDFLHAPAPRRRTRYVDEEPDVRPQPVMRLIAERRAEALHGPIGDWGDMHDIAVASGVPAEIVQQFIARNRHKIGNSFAQSELRRRRVNGEETTIMTEHFSPQFMAWAIESLKAALERHRQQLNSES